ncbi:MAG: CDP-6-deoxy-delta-3,4-glucoseen reductase [Gammaproteobacteria bacterium]|nr:CDP-6-deoxy-delta-3,4-glucoseen reductase [Gammaproteobacteria bacterium]
MTYNIKIQPSGHEFTTEEDESVLDAALRQGINLPYGCRSGECGACQGLLLSGKIYGQDENELSDGSVLFCQAQPASDLTIKIQEVDETRDILIKKYPCRIEILEKLSHDVMRVKLKIPEMERMQFLAGQYINILLDNDNPRSFSIANAPHDDEYIELHIREIPGGKLTHQIFHDMHRKDMLRIEGPLGSFFIREDSQRPLLLIGGGTGFAPLKGMLEHCFRTGLKQPIHLFWGAHGEQDLYLNKLPQQWAKEYKHFEYTPVLSGADDDGSWSGKKGLVTHLVVAKYPDLSGFDIYMSGAPDMIHSAVELFEKHGAQKERFFSDAFEFSAKPKKTNT